jgi:hypothetical protein
MRQQLSSWKRESSAFKEGKPAVEAGIKKWGRNRELRQ